MIVHEVVALWIARCGAAVQPQAYAVVTCLQCVALASRRRFMPDLRGAP